MHNIISIITGSYKYYLFVLLIIIFVLFPSATFFTQLTRPSNHYYTLSTEVHAADWVTPAKSDEPFTGPANWGGTGLMETPTARIMNENRFRFGAGQVDPYR
ncbi:MAG: YjbH domain-containing protein, partial [Pseudomonadota bacterium]|nr:YjbH domain-containing protein [Pseudomonadota bacterium]